MGCCDSKLKNITRDEPSFSLPTSPPKQWMESFRRNRERIASKRDLEKMQNSPNHSKEDIDIATKLSYNLTNDPLDNGVQGGNNVFAPKVGTNLIFQDALSSDVLCFEKNNVENMCLLSSKASAAVFKVAGITHRDHGAMLAIQCTTNKSKGKPGKLDHKVNEVQQGTFLFYDAQRQRLHSSSNNPTPLWQLVEVIDAVDGSKYKPDPTYVLRAVAKWWYPAVVLERCDSQGAKIQADKDMDGSRTPPQDSNNEIHGDLDGDSPASKAFKRLQNNADDGFSHSFESSLPPALPTKDALVERTPENDVQYTIRFRSGIVETVPLEAMYTADQVEDNKRAGQIANDCIEGEGQKWSVAFQPGDEVFVGPPHFSGQGQFVCRVNTNDPLTPQKTSDRATPSTPLILKNTSRQQREGPLTLDPDIKRAVRWNLMMS